MTDPPYWGVASAAAHSAARTASVQSSPRYALLMRRLLARCSAIMCAMVSASTWRGITRSKSAAIVSSVGASPERGAAGAACGASRSKAWSWVRVRVRVRVRVGLGLGVRG